MWRKGMKGIVISAPTREAKIYIHIENDHLHKNTFFQLFSLFYNYVLDIFLKISPPFFEVLLFSVYDVSKYIVYTQYTTHTHIHIYTMSMWIVNSILLYTYKYINIWYVYVYKSVWWKKLREKKEFYCGFGSIQSERQQ